MKKNRTWNLFSHSLSRLLISERDCHNGVREKKKWAPVRLLEPYGRYTRKIALSQHKKLCLCVPQCFAILTGHTVDSDIAMWWLTKWANLLLGFFSLPFRSFLSPSHHQPWEPMRLVTKLPPCNSLSQPLSSVDLVAKYEADFISLYKFTKGPQSGPADDIPHPNHVASLSVIPCNW